MEREYIITGRRSNGETVFVTENGLTPNAQSIAKSYNSLAKAKVRMAWFAQEWRGITDWKVELREN